MFERFLFYARALVRGNLRFCDKCWSLTECFRYGDSLKGHYDYMKKMDPEFEPFITNSRFKDWMVCINCCSQIDEMEGSHRNCCDKMNVQWRAGADGKLHAWKRDDEKRHEEGQEAPLEGRAPADDS